MSSMASYLTGSTDSEQNGQYRSSSQQCEHATALSGARMNVWEGILCPSATSRLDPAAQHQMSPVLCTP
jgi:hypothetical protein